MDRQVTIEVRFLSIHDSFLDQIGIDFNVHCPVETGFPESDEGTNSHGEPLVVDPSAIGGPAGSPVLVPFDPPVGSLLPTYFPQGAPPANPFSLFVELPGPGCIEFEAGFRRAVQGEVPTLPGPIPAATPATGLQLGAAILTPEQVTDLLARVQQEPLNRILDAPPATVFDGQILHVLLRNQLAELDELDPPFAAAASALSPPQGLVWLGPSLRLFPRILPAGDAVRLRILPDGPLAVVYPPAPITAGGEVGGTEVPVQRRSGVRTEVGVPDGGTVLIGGFISDPDTTVTPDLPLLRRLPVLGTLFRQPTEIQDADTLMILVTPRIILNSD